MFEVTVSIIIFVLLMLVGWLIEEFTPTELEEMGILLEYQN